MLKGVWRGWGSVHSLSLAIANLLMQRALCLLDMNGTVPSFSLDVDVVSCGKKNNGSATDLLTCSHAASAAITSQ